MIFRTRSLEYPRRRMAGVMSRTSRMSRMEEEEWDHHRSRSQDHVVFPYQLNSDR